MKFSPGPVSSFSFFIFLFPFLPPFPFPSQLPFLSLGGCTCMQDSLAVVEARSAGVRFGKGWFVPFAFTNRSPGVLAILPLPRSGCVRGLKRRTWRTQCGEAV